MALSKTIESRRLSSLSRSMKTSAPVCADFFQWMPRGSSPGAVAAQRVQLVPPAGARRRLVAGQAGRLHLEPAGGEELGKDEQIEARAEPACPCGTGPRGKSDEKWANSRRCRPRRGSSSSRVPRALLPAGRCGTSRAGPLSVTEKSSSQRGHRRPWLLIVNGSEKGRRAKRSPGRLDPSTASRCRFMRETTPDTTSMASMQASTR